MRISLSAILALVAILLAALALLDVVRAATALSLAVLCLAVGLLVHGVAGFGARSRL